MNPLNHFGIRTQFIRSDTKSYNHIKIDKENNISCSECGKHLGKRKDIQTTYDLMEEHLLTHHKGNK